MTEQVNRRSAARMVAPRVAMAMVFAAALVAVVASGAGPARAGDLAGRWGLGLDAGVMKLQEGSWDYGAPDL